MVTSDSAEGTCEHVLSLRKKFPKDGANPPRMSFRGAPGICRVKFLPQLGAAAPSRLWGPLTLSPVCPVL